MRVLLVEDDQMIGCAVQAALKDASYAADWVRDGEQALLSLRTHDYDLVLLDLGLPAKNGFEVLDEVRRSGNQVPLVVVTARDALEDRLHGLDAGADDYLLKPFEMSELLARARAVMRRKAGHATSLLSNGELMLNPATREVHHRDREEKFTLSSREYALLQALLMQPGQIFSRSELEEKIYGWGEEIESNAVEYFIHALRKKLGSDAIKNIRGVGWKVSKKD
ncbi:response regulator transcription factor [Pantoea sp. SOD02]|uniref:response regulator n=1 Tax=Pantoea sp. SOD02 TaxID=2970818 RepID=UPI002157126B|nr:response regulator transcription factor [Pantoea sp. SOD02]UVC31991.1 response regulator transcription factor [Pantoea sp. SOD02]